MNFVGPGSGFQFLFEEQGEVRESLSLPAPLRAIYGGDWLIPTGDQYRYSNFVISHDGKTSFAVPGHDGGGDISGFNRHDQWVMALTRSRADAVIVGANTLRNEPHHKWTSEFIFPEDASGFAELRKIEGRRVTPLQVFVTNSGQLSDRASVFEDKTLESIVATSAKGAAHLKSEGFHHATVIEMGEAEVDLKRLHEHLHHHFSVATVLCEGGPRFYGALIAERLIDEEFLTLSPVMVGSQDDDHRPGLIDGISLPPGNDLRGRLMSARRAGDHLFLRTRYTREAKS